MKLDRRVDMRQIRQISQKMGKLWSPEERGCELWRKLTKAVLLHYLKLYILNVYIKHCV